MTRYPKHAIIHCNERIVTRFMHCCSGFGELALLYSAPRAATVRAAAECRLWIMDRAVYNSIKHTYTVQLAAEKRALVASVPMLSVLSQVTTSVILLPHLPSHRHICHLTATLLPPLHPHRRSIMHSHVLPLAFFCNCHRWPLLDPHCHFCSLVATSLTSIMQQAIGGPIGVSLPLLHSHSWPLLQCRCHHVVPVPTIIIETKLLSRRVVDMHSFLVLKLWSIN
jgi:hypothetical protein